MRILTKTRHLKCVFCLLLAVVALLFIIGTRNQLVCLKVEGDHVDKCVKIPAIGQAVESARRFVNTVGQARTMYTYRNTTKGTPIFWTAADLHRVDVFNDKKHPEKHEILTDQYISTLPTATPHGKHTHVGFLKVHKAGSSTLQHLFFRFGLKYGLSFALPKKGNYLMSKKDVVPMESKKYFDIFAVHTVFNQSMFDELLPNNSLKIAIVRKPLDRMISAAYFYRHVYPHPYLVRIPRSKLIESLIEFPEKFDTDNFSKTKNSMGKDFGFPPDLQITDVEDIQYYLHYLNDQFSLVMVMERFAESLILMKKLLNWTWSDILYYPTNAYKHDTVSLTNENKLKFNQTCFLDVAIYDFFSEILENKIQNEGEEFLKEVSLFKTIIKDVSEFCGGDSWERYEMVVDANRWSERFVVTQSDCKLMQVSEIPFIRTLRQRHRRMFREKSASKM